MKTFTKWFILTSITITSAFFAQQYELFSLLLENDVSYMCLVIMLLYAGFSAYCGKLSKEIDKSSGRANEAFNKKLKIVEFIADNSTILGLLGTVVGMTYMMANTLGGGLDVANIILQLKTGSATAFYTTICGIVANILLNTQLLLIRNRISTSHR